MGAYLNPPQKLPQIGRKLTGNSYSELVAQLKPGEQLMGHYDRYIFQNAVHLYSENEFNGFESQVRSGQITRLGFYAISKEDYEKYVR